MKIGILGTGKVAQALAGRWRRQGVEVTFGSRNPETRRAALAGEWGADLRLVSAESCVRQSETLLLAVPWHSAEATLSAVKDGQERIVIDCLNPLLPNLQGRSLPEGRSTLHELSERYPAMRWVKAFNAASSATLADPSFDGSRLTMPYCGDHAPAKTEVANWIELAGFEPIDAGGADAAPWLETLALLSIRVAILQGWGGDCAVQWLRRNKR